MTDSPERRLLREAYRALKRCYESPELRREIDALLAQPAITETQQAEPVAMPRMDDVLLACGEMTAGERRAVMAALRWFISTRCRAHPPAPIVARSGAGAEDADALRRDAERYRWLRSRVPSSFHEGLHFHFVAPMHGGGSLEATLELHRSALDAAIDAARGAAPSAEEKGEGK